MLRYRLLEEVYQLVAVGEAEGFALLVGALGVVLEKGFGRGKLLNPGFGEEDLGEHLVGSGQELVGHPLVAGPIGGHGLSQQGAEVLVHDGQVVEAVLAQDEGGIGRFLVFVPAGEQLGIGEVELDLVLVVGLTGDVVAHLVVEEGDLVEVAPLQGHFAGKSFVLAALVALAQ